MSKYRCVGGTHTMSVKQQVHKDEIFKEIPGRPGCLISQYGRYARVVDSKTEYHN